MRFLLLGIVALLVGCSERSEPITHHTPDVPSEELTEVLKGDWPPVTPSRVVGYRYDIPPGAYNARLLDGDADWKHYRLHHTELARLTRASKDLTKPQIERLLVASFSEEGQTGLAGCYQPHHIFVFHAPDGSVTQAIEVCFECRSILIAPIPTGEPPSADLRKLAALCDELGLWAGEETAAEYISNLAK